MNIAPEQAMTPHHASTAMAEPGASRAMVKREITLPEPALIGPDCVIVLNETGHIRHFTPEAEYLFGYKAPEVQDSPFGVLLPPDGRSPFAFGWPWPNGNAHSDYIIIGHHADGGMFPMRFSAYGAGQSADRHYTGAIRDLRNEVARDQQRRRLLAELIRTARVGEMDHLARTVSEPLRALRQTAVRRAGALEQDATQSMLAPLSRVAQSASRMIQVWRDTIAVSAVEPQAEPIREIIDVASGSALAGVRHAMTLIVKVAASAAAVRVDRDAIQPVLAHLIGEAAGLSGAPSHQDTTVATARLGDMVEISVSGPGPAASRQGGKKPRAFGFDESAGAALAHSRNVVEARGGHLHAAVGRRGGTVFRLALPAADARVAA